MKAREEVIMFCSKLSNTYEDMQFHDPNWTLMRHEANKKVFAWIYEKDGYIWINVKCNPEWRDFFRSAYPSVIPGYHLNKEHWNSIILDGSVPEQDIKRMIEESYDLTKPKKRKQRINYAIAFVLLTVIEVLIALFVHDAFVRPYLGDVLVVVVLYCAVRIVIPNGCRLLPLYLFLFAALVEGLQYFQLVYILRLENITFLRVLVGSVFDVKDIICYGVGCILLGVYEGKIKGKCKR